MRRTSTRSVLFVVGMLCLVAPCEAQEGTSGANLLLQSIQDEYWEFRLRESPLLASSVGDRRYNDRLDSVSLADYQRRSQQQQAFLEQLEAIDAEELDDDARINRQILMQLLRYDLGEYEYGVHLTPINQRSGFHLEFPQLQNDIPLVTTEDYENYLARLQAFERYANQNLELLRTGLERGIVLPAVVMEGWEKGVDAQIVASAAESSLYDPFEKIPSTVPAAEHERLQRAARDAIEKSVVPAYRELRKFLENDYVPQLRDTIAAVALPEGRDFYRHRVRLYTTTDMTPDEVHQLGLREVARIRGEMEQIIKEVEFSGDFAEFLEFLREDPRFYADTPEELMKEVAYILKEIDGQLPSLFGKLPRTPYGIRQIPDYVAPRTTSAYYWRASGDGTKAGFFYVNTYNLKSRPFYNLEALSAHEAVPGHHLQLALQQELEGLPEFRRYADFVAFIEGWALYSERLGLELGLYEDPYSDFGRLTMEIWRACRLVVDTGMHYFGWSRAQAIDYLAENSALAMHDIQSEIDRYISWPGQALAYKVGELKIRELRKKAEEHLGTRFDVREFHDVVLAQGALPLDLLETHVDEWLARKTDSPSPPRE